VVLSIDDSECTLVIGDAGSRELAEMLTFEFKLDFIPVWLYEILGRRNPVFPGT